MSNPNERGNPTSPESGKSYISRRVSHEEVLSLAFNLWRGQKQVAETIASEAMQIINEAYDVHPSFFGNKSKKWILGGLFYLLGMKNGEPKTQKQIARSLDTNEMTIRDSYKKWLKNFPEFWRNSD